MFDVQTWHPWSDAQLHLQLGQLCQDQTFQSKPSHWAPFLHPHSHKQFGNHMLLENKSFLFKNLNAILKFLSGCNTLPLIDLFFCQFISRINMTYIGKTIQGVLGPYIWIGLWLGNVASCQNLSGANVSNHLHKKGSHALAMSFTSADSWFIYFLQ